MLNFWRFFKRGDVKKSFLKFTPEGAHFRVVTWNFDLPDPAARRWIIEIHGGENQQIEWEQKGKDHVSFFKKKKLQEQMAVNRNSGDLMNLAIHSTLKCGLVSNHEFMVTPVPGATNLDIQTETRALQWIQATFETVKRALLNLKNNPGQILTGACFMGKVPETGEEVFRVIIFNLDIFYYLRPDFTLQIVVFDDKNLGHGESKIPAYQQIIKVTKPQFYDEITKLVNCIALAGEIR